MINHCIFATRKPRKKTKNKTHMAILQRGQHIDQYIVQSLIKQNLYTETYRVEDNSGTPFFMKVFVMKRMPEKLIDSDTPTPKEIVYVQKIRHKNLVSFIAKGAFDTEESNCQYYTCDYLNGELLADKIQRDGKLPAEQATAIYRDILNALQAMHEQGLFHNDITPRNIMLPATAQGGAEIIDMGHVAPKCTGQTPFDTNDLDILYCANETFGGLYDEQSDIFAATAVLYTMLTGTTPWPTEFTEAMKWARRAMILKEKRKEQPIDYNAIDVDNRLKAVLAKGMAVAYEDRYKNIRQIIGDLDGEEVPQIPAADKPAPSQHATDSQNQEADSPNKTTFEIKRGSGNGFKDIAGMEELKTYLSQRVIFVIKNKEIVEKYKLAAPNGMLLYGPPGCGKSFVAEKFAEETGFNFILVKSSDLASTFVHGSQEKIAQLFKEAEQKAPIVICFDEFDALVPDRSNPAAQYSAGEVNEFLTQLNNCSKRGIFVVGTTNRPDKIDPAVLRTGRIDKQVYVPLPDKEARKKMFLIHLQGRPFDAQAIDVEKLSEMSEGFIASDIAYVVNDAAMVAAFTNQAITEEILETSVRNTHPSLRPDTMRIYEDIRQKMENTQRRDMARPKIGFV